MGEEDLGGEVKMRMERSEVRERSIG